MAKMTTIRPNKGGAPRGNQNRLVHGRYTREMREFRARVRVHLRDMRALTVELKAIGRRRCVSSARPVRGGGGTIAAGAGGGV